MFHSITIFTVFFDLMNSALDSFKKKTLLTTNFWWKCMLCIYLINNHHAVHSKLHVWVSKLTCCESAFTVYLKWINPWLEY